MSELKQIQRYSPKYVTVNEASGVTNFVFGSDPQGAYVTYADHAAMVFDLEHRLANCDADLFKMQQELAEEKLRSQPLRAHADELAEKLNDAERRLGEADKLVAAAMDFSKYAASILVGDHAPSQEWKDGFLELGEPLQIELAAWIEGQPA